MKEHPILFSAPMVRAILDGSKTQTRRLVKPQPTLIQNFWHWLFKKLPAGYCHTNREALVRLMTPYCPYGQPGDQLWVRETWLQPGLEPVIYRADKWAEKLVDDCRKNSAAPQLKWKPSIHMPRWASRIQLEITGIRVERLQDCSEADAIAEGVEPIGFDNKYQKVHHWKTYTDPTKKTCWSAKSSYQTLWESINGEGSWEDNPWVWVVEFKRVKP